MDSISTHSRWLALCLRLALLTLVVSLTTVGQLASRASPAEAGSHPGSGADLDRRDLEVKQELRAKGLGAVVDRMTHRIDHPVPGPAGIRYGITEGTSSNWGGYMADAYQTNYVAYETRGWFNVTSAPSSGAHVASWTGIGGYRGTKKLWQTGVDQTSMLGWTEFLPDYPQYWFVVYAGDTAFSDVFYTVSQAKWTLVISDQTTGDYHSEVRYNDNPDFTTAEWITEVTPPGSAIPFFQHVSFTSSSWWDNTGTYNAIDSARARTTWHWVARIPNTNPTYCIYPDSIVGGNNFNNWWGC